MGKGMRAGKKMKQRVGGGMPDMKKIAAMQEEVAKQYSEIENEVFDVSVGGGAIKIKINGKKEVVSLEIDDEVLEDKEMLTDLLVSGFNEAVKKVENFSEERMSGLTGGLNIPGL